MNTILMPRAGVFNPARGGDSVDLAIKGRSIPVELPQHRRLCDRLYAEYAEIDAKPFVETEKARLKAVALERTKQS